MATIYTEEHIIGKVLEFREYWGHWPRARHARMSNILNFSRRTVHRRFGGWDEMLVKAKAAYVKAKQEERQPPMYKCADCGYERYDRGYFVEIGGRLYCRNCKWVHLPKTKLQLGLEEAAEKLGLGCRLLLFDRRNRRARMRLPPAVINRWGETYVWEDAHLHIGLDHECERASSCSLSVTSYELTTGRRHPHCYHGDMLCGGDHLGDILHYFDRGDYLGGVMNAHMGVSSYNPGHAQRQLHNVRCGVCDQFIIGSEYLCTECEQLICRNCKHQVLGERPDLAWDCICKDCKANVCEHCGHKFKDSESVGNCLRCRKRVCPECATDEGNKCAICNGPEQLDGGASYMCHSCRHECFECGRTMCERHMAGSICQECASTTCEVCGEDYIREGRGCSSCNKEVCPVCLETCDTCGEMFCKDCLYQCVVDQYWVCEEHRNICLCGKTVCDFCYEMNNWQCAECGHPLCPECAVEVDGEKYCDLHAPADEPEDEPDDGPADEPEETPE